MFGHQSWFWCWIIAIDKFGKHFEVFHQSWLPDHHFTHIRYQNISTLYKNKFRGLCLGVRVDFVVELLQLKNLGAVPPYFFQVGVPPIKLAPTERYFWRERENRALLTGFGVWPRYRHHRTVLPCFDTILYCKSKIA